MSRTPIIQLKNISVTFGQGESETQALHDVSLDIYAGEYVIIFGPSGCGKSTLMNCIAGLEQVTNGELKVRGANIAKLNEAELSLHRRQKIGMVFQQFNVLRTLTVLDNVALPQLFHGVNLHLRRTRAMKLLKVLGLEKHAKKIPSELSGGQQQRVAIARSLINNPWIILADEPTGNLDSKAANEVMDLFQSLNHKSKRTLIMVTHNNEHLKFADRVIYMRDGKIEKETKHTHHKAHHDDDDMPDITSLSSLVKEEKK